MRHLTVFSTIDSANRQSRKSFPVIDIKPRGGLGHDQLFSGFRFDLISVTEVLRRLDLPGVGI